jgi:hypothetical protein
MPLAAAFLTAAMSGRKPSPEATGMLRIPEHGERGVVVEIEGHGQCYGLAGIGDGHYQAHEGLVTSGGNMDIGRRQFCAIDLRGMRRIGLAQFRLTFDLATIGELLLRRHLA